MQVTPDEIQVPLPGNNIRIRLMSFLETGKERSTWIAAASQSSVRRAPGCAQCGRTLEMNELGTFNLSGKCLNCTDWVSEDDEAFEELED